MHSPMQATRVTAQTWLRWLCASEDSSASTRVHSQQAAFGEVSHERAGPKGPGLAIGGKLHPVDQLAELRRSDRDNVPDLVREALARCIAVLDGREHGAEKQHRTIRVAMVRPDHLCDEVLWVAADLGDGRRTLQAEAVRSLDNQRDRGAANVVERECVVEKAQQWTDRAGGVVVLGLAQQQRRTALEVA